MKPPIDCPIIEKKPNLNRAFSPCYSTLMASKHRARMKIQQIDTQKTIIITPPNKLLTSGGHGLNRLMMKI